VEGRPERLSDYPSRMRPGHEPHSQGIEKMRGQVPPPQLSGEKIRREAAGARKSALTFGRPLVKPRRYHGTYRARGFAARWPYHRVVCATRTPVAKWP